MAINLEMLQEKAKDVRIDIIRQIHSAGSGHPGGSLSAADIITYLYFAEMNIDPQDPHKAGRDRFVLSKGHAAPALYAALAEKGYFLKRHSSPSDRRAASFRGIPTERKFRGSICLPVLWDREFLRRWEWRWRTKSTKRRQSVLCVGRRRASEGMVWEAAMAAAHYGLSNLTIFVDHNGLQIDGRNEDVITVAPIAEKFESFGWDVQKIDGHDFEQIAAAVENARRFLTSPRRLSLRR